MICPFCGSSSLSTEGVYCYRCQRYVKHPVMGEPLIERSNLEYGWVCPRCGIVNNPRNKTCECITSTKNDVVTDMPVSVKEAIEDADRIHSAGGDPEGTRGQWGMGNL